MQLIRKTLAFGQLPSSKGDLYVPASGRKGFAHNVLIHNTNTTAESVVLNFHDGTSEHQVLSQDVAAGDTLFLEFPGEGEVVDEGAKFTGNTTTASKVTFKFSGTEEIPDAVAGGGSAAGVSSNLWAPPATAHAEDDEFEATALTGWSVQNLDGPAVGSISYGTVDAYDTTFNSGNVMRVNAHTDGRRSWALLQTPGSSDEFALYKSYTFPTNVLVYTRPHFSQKVAGLGAVAGDTEFGLAFMKDTAGVPTLASRLVLLINRTDTGVYRAAFIRWTTGGVETTIGETDDVDARGQAIQYLALHKVGTTYYAWAYTGGVWIYVNSVTEATMGFTPDMVGFVQHQVSTSNIVNPVGTDFIRFVETDKFLL